jgi:metal-responsive CopG/Arc/MetJ family transcriptional regulator
MSQLNINITPDFEKDLKRYMKKKGLKQKSQAIRSALRDASDLLEVKEMGEDYHAWLGVGLKVSPRSKPRFASDDDLWE